MADHLQALDAYHLHLAQLPARHPRRVGWWLMGIGTAALMGALPFGVAVQHAAFALAMVGAVVSGAPLHRMPAFRIGMVFALWQVVSMALTVWLGHHAGKPQRGLGLMYIWLVMPVALAAFHDLRVRRWAFHAVAVTTVVSTLLAAGQFFIGLDESRGRFAIDPSAPRFIHGTGFHPIHLTQGYIMALIALLFLHQPAIVGGLRATERWGGSFLAVLGVFMAKARCAYLGLPAALAAVVAARGGRRLLLGGAVLVGALGIAIGALYAVSPERATEMLKGQNGRWAIWRTSVALLAEHPVIGTGGANAFTVGYQRLYPTLNPEVPDETKGEGHAHAHSSLLTIACEHGIPAALLFLAFLGRLLHASWGMRRLAPARWDLSLGVVALAMVAGLFENLAAHTAPSYATWMALALAMSAGSLPTTDRTT